MRMTWPLSITLSFIVFAGFMTGFAIFSTQNPPELVADNYYELDAEYDQMREQIDRWNRICPSCASPIWENDSLVLFLPPMLIDSDSGRVYFYKPDQRSLDFIWTWQQLLTSKGRLASHHLAHGRWVVSIQAWKDGEGFSHRFNIQKP